MTLLIFYAIFSQEVARNLMLNFNNLIYLAQSWPKCSQHCQQFKAFNVSWQSLFSILIWLEQGSSTVWGSSFCMSSSFFLFLAGTGSVNAWLSKETILGHLGPIVFLKTLSFNTIFNVILCKYLSFKSSLLTAAWIKLAVAFAFLPLHVVWN